MAFLKKHSVWVVAGLLLGMGFIWPFFWPVSVAAIGYHFYLLQQDFSLSSKLWGSFIVWMIKSLCFSAYYWSTIPMNWLPFDFGAGEYGLVFVYWVTVAMMIGVGGVALALFVEGVKRVPAPPWLMMFVIFPLAWIGAELVESLSFSFFSYGEGSELNIYFSLGYVGLLLGEHLLLAQLGWIGGLYGLSFFAAVAGVGLWQVWQHQNKKLRYVVAGVLFLVWMTTNSIFIPEKSVTGESYSVALIENTFPVSELFSRETKDGLATAQQEAMAAALAISPDYILLPEDARYFDQTQDLNIVKSFFNFQHPDAETIIIDSSRVDRPDKPSILQAFVFDTGTSEHVLAHKRYLVPQGEFMPYIHSSLFRLLGFGDLVDNVENLLSYEIGPLTSQASFADRLPGILFCFESSSALGVRTLVNERPNLPFVAHPVSHSWFHTPTNFWQQLDVSLRVQAIWNQKYIVSAGSFVDSQLFTPRGNIIEPELVAEGEYWKVRVAKIPIE